MWGNNKQDKTQLSILMIIAFYLCDPGAIPFNKFGKRMIFYTKELDEWIKQNALRVKTREEIEREASEYLSKAARKRLDRS